MNKIEAISNWMGDRHRKYSEGVVFFTEFAQKKDLNTYGNYLAEIKDDEVNQFDPHFTLLLGKVCDIFNCIRIAPQNYPEAFNEVVLKIADEMSDDLKSELKNYQEEIEALTAEIDDLNSQITDFEDDSETRSEEIEALQLTISEKEETIKKLQGNIETIAGAGIKIVTEKDLPADIALIYARIKEITPLYAHLHAQLIDAATDDDRKVIANQLCELDDERRAAWDKIDDWSEGRVLSLEPKQNYSEEALVRGLEISRRMIRLTENIKRSKVSADRFRSDGKLNKEMAALKRIAEYEKELSTLQEELDNAKK